ncbi:hypothetical protein PIB30_084201 [Stylosanthes scabra]|uniref:Uncharacterized protein n=1 Tax=Stylosanthes scabra TaxID=79078 RepID=A0ABU6UUW0_9FABA|nr:hypothetical protein [Stylosanthes scabra]
MTSCVGWLPAPDDYLGIKPKYGSLTVKCRGPSPKRPAIPLRKCVLRVPQEEHDDHLEPLWRYSSSLILAQAGRHPRIEGVAGLAFGLHDYVEPTGPTLTQVYPCVVAVWSAMRSFSETTHDNGSKPMMI